MAINHRVILAAGSAIAIAVMSSAAHAGAFGIREQSAMAQGESFAGAASGSGGLSSMFWNPATITMAPGWTSEYNVSYIAPSAKITPMAPTPTLPFGSSGDIGESAAVPSSYNAYQINDRIWVGLASTAPFGLITKPRDFWAGQVYSRSSKVYSLNFAPILGIKITDWLSIGVGPTIEYFQTRLKQATGVGPTAGNAILEGDDIGTGATFGVTVTPLAGTTIGVGYRSSVHHELDGSLRTPLAFVPVRVNLNMPDQLTVGISQAVLPNVKIDAGFEWTNWSRLGTAAITATQLGAPVSAFPLNYKDGYLYSLGAEYQWSPQWAFRAGIAYEQSPIDLSNRSTRLPDNDRIYASLGATYRYSDKLEFTAAYSHLFKVGSNRIAITPGNPNYVGLPFFADDDTSVDIVSLGLKYRWDDTRVAEAAPIVRKY